MQPVIQVQDANGNAVASPGIAVMVTVSSGAVLLGETTASTGSSGAAAFSGLSLTSDPGGMRTLTFAAPGLLSTSATVTVTGLISIAFISGNDQTAAPGSAVAIPPSVRVRTSADGNAVPGLTVVFAIASGGGTATGAMQITNAAGIATVGSWTLGATPGINTLSVSLVGYPPLPPFPFFAIAEGQASAFGVGPKLILVQNFLEELKRLVPN